MRYETVIFDLDGTLLNTLEDLKQAVNYALAKYGKPTRTLEEIRQFVGNGIKILIERSVPAETSNEEREEILSAFRVYYGEHCRDTTAPYKGIKEVLEILKKEGVNTAVVSNKADFAVQELIPIYFGDSIAVAKGENEETGIKKKPNPDMVYAVMEYFGSTPAGTVYVGDSDVDLQTAKNAGLDCIGCSWGFRGRAFLEKEGAGMIADEPKDILKFVY